MVHDLEGIKGEDAWEGKRGTAVMTRTEQMCNIII